MLGSKWNVGSWSVRFFFIWDVSDIYFQRDSQHFGRVVIYFQRDSWHFGRVVRSAVAREHAGRFEKVCCSEEALVRA